MVNPPSRDNKAMGENRPLHPPLRYKLEPFSARKIAIFCSRQLTLWNRAFETWHLRKVKNEFLFKDILTH